MNLIRFVVGFAVRRCSRTLLTPTEPLALCLAGNKEGFWGHLQMICLNKDRGT